MKRKPAKQKRRIIWVVQYENGQLDRMWYAERPTKIFREDWKIVKIVKFVEV